MEMGHRAKHPIRDGRESPVPGMGTARVDRKIRVARIAAAHGIPPRGYIHIQTAAQRSEWISPAWSRIPHRGRRTTSGAVLHRALGDGRGWRGSTAAERLSSWRGVSIQGCSAIVSWTTAAKPLSDVGRHTRLGSSVVTPALWASRPSDTLGDAALHTGCVARRGVSDARTQAGGLTGRAAHDRAR